MHLARQSVSKRARRSPQLTRRPEFHRLWWGPHSDFHDWPHIVLPGASIRRKRHENVMSNVIVSQMFVLAIKGGSTTNRWLVAMDTPTDTHKGPHPTPPLSLRPGWSRAFVCLRSSPTRHHTT